MLPRKPRLASLSAIGNKVTNDFCVFLYIYAFYSCPTSRPRVSDLVNGKISKFTIDALLTMLAKTGKTAELNIRT
ncbi:XRE family transcriptional regulator [Neisseria sp.]